MHRKQSLRDFPHDKALQTRSKPAEKELTQKRDSNKAGATQLYWNSSHTLEILLKRNISEGVLLMHLQHTHRKYGKPTPFHDPC